MKGLPGHGMGMERKLTSAIPAFYHFHDKMACYMAMPGAPSVWKQTRALPPLQSSFPCLNSQAVRFDLFLRCLVGCSDTLKHMYIFLSQHHPSPLCAFCNDFPSLTQQFWEDSKGIFGDHSLTSRSELCCTNGSRSRFAHAQLCLSAAPGWFLMPRLWHSLSCCCEPWTASLFACYRKNTTKDQTSFILNPAKSVPTLWLAATLLLRSQPPLVCVRKLKHHTFSKAVPQIIAQNNVLTTVQKVKNSHEFTSSLCVVFSESMHREAGTVTDYKNLPLYHQPDTESL